MTIELGQMSIVELKALAYDIISKLEKNQQQLAEVNSVIAKKLSETPPAA